MAEARWVVMCALCQQQPEASDQRGDNDFIDCSRCGKYVISDTAQSTLKRGSHADSLWILRSVVRNATAEGQELKLTTYNISDLIAAAPVPRSPLEVMERLLLRFGAGRTPHRGFRAVARVPMSDHVLYYLADEEDLPYALHALEEAGLIQNLKIVNGVADARVTVKGWERIAELQKSSTDSWQAFVAMRFSPDLEPAYFQGIEPALRATGYSAMRVDRQHFNDKIDDKIVAEIRRSGLVVADFTEHAGGVYFEAGLGMGRNIPVIYTCREDQIGKAHFDTRQYPHLLWTDPAELQRKLIDRIRATLPTRAPIGA